MLASLQITSQQNPLIFTDLDGTLLDHDDYSFAAAQVMLNKLAQRKIPVIPNTSKTRAEVFKLRQAMALQGPFIVENGAAVYMPTDFLPEQAADTQEIDGYWCKTFAPPRSQWIDLLDALQAQYGDLFRHFAAMSIEQVMAATGLNAADAQLAKQREFGEPLEWLGTATQKISFIKTLQELGANPVEGGRFMHLKGDTDKGLAMQWLIEQCQQQLPEHNWVSIALGDGQNDVSMLQMADYPVRIVSPVNPLPVLNNNKPVITSTLSGPAGWAECLESLLFS
ncbi:HAD-IIB family hydrolase [Paraglaciecola hydrolytica]|uniref:Mannosyl-3-phosphoglycerate phosphatase n=1 Tax=Paraglaciecola hydrolytica TaxID=1799789 RepID=A0A148KN98_9ALTE|nr:HAD-IIB family hydrolase [Paraglaciecola hydrolytica]KXI27729.1 mannosyl-3-phosphoglycerate phosphatase [Paraglaciecola hydrolytica]